MGKAVAPRANRGRSSPLVSVIIPAYNASAYVGRAVESALSQTYRNLEVIVVDDGSQDQTVAVVRSLAALDNRVRLIEQPNRGVATARNTAIQAAHGEFIAPLDADDIWYPEKIERQVRRFRESPPEVGLVYTWWVAIDEAEAVLWGSARWDLEGDVYEPLIVTNFIGNASVPLIRRSCIEELGNYDVDLRAQRAQGCEDWDIALRIAERFEFRVVPDYLVGYRRLKDSMSWDRSTMGRSYELVVRDIPQRHPDISKSVFRWSRKHFFHWLASRSYLRGNYGGALRWLAKAVYCDPVALLSRPVVSTFFKSSVQALALPIIRLIWSDHQEWVRFRSRCFRREHKTTSLSAIRASSNHSPFPEKLRSWSPYDRICLRRWERMDRERSKPGAVSRSSSGAQRPTSKGIHQFAKPPKVWSASTERVVSRNGA